MYGLYLKLRKIKWGSYIILSIYAAYIILPVLWLLYTSLKPTSEVYSVNWPSRISLDSYVTVLEEYNFLNFFNNSFIVAILTTLTITTLSVLAVYGFTKFRSKFSSKALSLIIGLRMIPFVTIVVPLFLMMAKFNLIDSKLSLIIGNVAFNLPMAIWLLIPFFLEFPKDLMEAARIDGCGRIKTLTHVVLPVVKSGVMVIVVFMFVNTWNEFMYALVMNTGTTHMTLPIAISLMTSQYGPRWDLQTAAAMMYILPVILVTSVFQKHIVGGMTAGAIKG